MFAASSAGVVWAYVFNCLPSELIAACDLPLPLLAVDNTCRKPCKPQALHSSREAKGTRGSRRQSKRVVQASSGSSAFSQLSIQILPPPPHDIHTRHAPELPYHEQPHPDDSLHHTITSLATSSLTIPLGPLRPV